MHISPCVTVYKIWNERISYHKPSTICYMDSKLKVFNSYIPCNNEPWNYFCQINFGPCHAHGFFSVKLFTHSCIPWRTYAQLREFFVYLNVSITWRVWSSALFQQYCLRNKAILYNYRLLMRSTHDHENRVSYWLTDAEGGGQPIPDKVFMVMSRPKSKVYYCFIKLSGIFLHKDWNIHSYCFLSRPLS